jgi:hypothetical protein
MDLILTAPARAGVMEVAVAPCLALRWVLSHCLNYGGRRSRCCISSTQERGGFPLCHGTEAIISDLRSGAV